PATSRHRSEVRGTGPLPLMSTATWYAGREGGGMAGVGRRPRHSPGAEQQRLQVLSLAMRQGAGMIGRMAVRPDELQGASRVARRSRNHLAEALTVEMLGARAGEEPAAGCEAAHGVEVHVLVAAQSRLEVTATAHEGRRVEHDQVEAITRGAQVLEDVRLDPRRRLGREAV